MYFSWMLFDTGIRVFCASALKATFGHLSRAAGGQTNHEGRVLQLTSKAKGVEGASWVEGVQVLKRDGRGSEPTFVVLLYVCRAGMLESLDNERQVVEKGFQ